MLRFCFGITIAAIALCSHPSKAAEPWERLATPAFETVSRREGLPHPIVTSVAEDIRGFIWAGTQGGLARYDGFRVRSYLADASDEHSLPDAYILSLHADRGGKLWVGTAGGGAAWYDVEQDRFVRLPVGENGLPSPVVLAFADDGAGGVWIGTRNGLFRQPAEQPGYLVAGLPDSRVTSLWQDGSGAVWVGTQGGLAYIPAGSNSPEPAAGILPGLPVRVLGADGAGHLLVALTTAEEDQVWRVGPAGLAPLTNGRGKPIGFARGGVIGARDAGNGRLWLAQQRDGVIILDPETGETVPVRHDAADRQSLPDNAVFSILRDNAGMIWLGTRDGLAHHDPTAHGAMSVRYSPLRKGGLNSADPMTVEALADGRVLVGYLAGGIDVLEPATGDVQHLPVSGAGLPVGAVLDLQFFQEQLFAALQHGLAQIDLRTGAAEPIPLPVTDRLVQSLLVWRNRLWVGGRAGLFVLNGVGEAVQRYRCEESAEDAFETLTNIMVLRAAPDGKLWIGTPSGVLMLDPDSCLLEPLHHDAAERKTLPPGLISTLHFDHKGRPWVGTMGGGLGVGGPDGATEFTRLDAASGLPSNNIGQIVEDADGSIWLSTADGLARISSALEVISLKSSEGISIPAYWVRSGSLTAAGDVVFGGGGGLSVVRPTAMRSLTRNLPVRITSLRVGGEERPLPYENASVDLRSVAVPGNRRSLSVEFAALSYGAANPVHYRYRLEGFDAEWTERDANERITAYTNLPPGDYMLRIEAASSDGRALGDAISLPVRVAPDWYQTTPFRLGMAALAAGFLVLIVQLRTAVLRRRQRQLEREVGERTRALEEANRQLEHLANTDPLTGILNRRPFMQSLQSERARACRYKDGFSVLQIDLDHFKHINDTYGHAAGDTVLQAVASRISILLRSVDIFGRLGGEEFAVMLPQTDVEGARHTAERILACVGNQPVLHDGRMISVTVSIGGSTWHAPADTVDLVLRRADEALYAAKHAGRNCFIQHDRPAIVVGESRNQEVNGLSGS